MPDVNATHKQTNECTDWKRLNILKIILLPTGCFARSAHDAGHLWTQIVYMDLCTNVKDKDRIAGGNPICTALYKYKVSVSLH